MRQRTRRVEDQVRAARTAPPLQQRPYRLQEGELGQRHLAHFHGRQVPGSVLPEPVLTDAPPLSPRRLQRLPNAGQRARHPGGLAHAALDLPLRFQALGCRCAGLLDAVDLQPDARRGAARQAAEVLGGHVVLVVDMCDPLRRAQRAHLPGVQRRSARALDAVRARQLADDEEVRHRRFPPPVHGESAVAVLIADADLQRLRPQVRAQLAVEVDAGRVHVRQPFDGRRLHGAGPLEVGERLIAERVDAERLQPVRRPGVLAEVHEDAAPAPHHLVLHQDVDERGTGPGDLLRIEGPLVAFQEDVGGQRGHRVEPRVEELAHVAAGPVRAEVTRDGLLVRAGQVPARLERGQAELGLCQVVCGGARLQQRGVGPHLPLRVDRHLVQLARPAARRDHVRAVEQHQAMVVRLLTGHVGAEQAARATVAALLADDGQQVVVLEDRDAAARQLRQQLAHHEARRPGPGRRAALARVQVRLVADETAALVVRERDAQVDQVVEAAQRVLRLGQRHVPVHASAGHEGLGEVVRRVGH